MKPRLLLLAGLLLPALAAAAAAPVVVDQVGRTFSLRGLQLHRNDTVRFRNADDFIHHIYIESPTFSFKSAEQERGSTIDVQFPVNGTFEVRCEIHPRMRMTIAVD